jgi:hypothetical protein
MNFIKNYNSQHYRYFLKKIKFLMGKNIDVNKWIKSLNDNHLKYWIYVIMSFENNNSDHYEEISILLTTIIRLFILELEIDTNQIKLKNKDIKRLVTKLKYSLYREYSNRNNITKFSDEEYSLL